MNGYFQLDFRPTGTYLDLYPPTDGGKPVDINELLGYLQRCSIEADLIDLKEAVTGLSEKRSVFLSKSSTVFVSETVYVSVSPDHMTAYAVFYPPSVNGPLMDKNDIVRALENEKIVYGINESMIEEFLKTREYCKEYVIAEGKPPRHGKDASIDYFFNPELKVKPKEREDGSVDFFNLSTVNHCKKGDLLARLHREDVGDFGESILGEKIRPRDVKRLSLKYGRNININEERTELTSQVNGHVTLVEGKVFVSNIYEVENVDISTGNIEYDGNVQVNNNICDNFRVIAHGNIEVRGIVEGAYVEADGDIIIARGMIGMSKGILKAGGNVIVKFIENATVMAGGFVETESILHSTVMAKTEINVVSKKGFISGGRVSATNRVKVKSLGSPMGANTVVEIGIDPAMKIRYAELQKEIVKNRKSMDSIEPIIQNTNEKIAKGIRLKPEQLDYAKTLMLSMMELKKKIKSDEKEMADIQVLLDSQSTAEVCVSGEVYPGTIISISDVSMVVKANISYCRFRKEQGDVKMMSL